VRVTTAVLDTAQREAVQAWADASAAAHGHVNLVFNNAGVALSALLEDVKPADFEWLMGINFWGVVWGTQAFLPHLRASGDGHVINLSSLFGILAMPLNGTYNASKFAVRGYTEALRMELEITGAPVSATCVHPGGVRTSIARSARVDASTERITGPDVASARAQADRTLNTTTPESAALQILRAVERNQRRVLVGPDAKIADKFVRLFGTRYQALLVGMMRRRMARAKVAAGPASGGE
jgi:short-subunit dehydrogenase